MVYKDKSPRIHDVDLVVATGRIYSVKQQPCFRIQQVIPESEEKRRENILLEMINLCSLEEGNTQVWISKGQPKEGRNSYKKQMVLRQRKCETGSKKIYGSNNNIKGSGKKYYSVEIQ